tara:strand:+ start:369 stop:596 length:228 start_codon:yes stop_codon:yes gene_type:complete
VGILNIGDIVTCKRPPYNEPECKTIKASRIFNHNEYYIILEFWYNDLSLCSIMSCYGEISWIRSRNLKLICGTSK